MSSVNISETLSTLRFGTKAKKLRNKPRVNAERSTAEYKKLLKASDIRVGELLAMVQELQNEILGLKKKLKNIHVAGSARNVINIAKQLHQQQQQGGDIDDTEGLDSDDSDDEGISWIPQNDEDLRVENEEIEGLKEKVSSLEVLLQSYKSRSEAENRKLLREESVRREEERRRASRLAEKESLSQYTKGWQVGQRAAADAYDEEALLQREEDEKRLKVTVERERVEQYAKGLEFGKKSVTEAYEKDALGKAEDEKRSKDLAKEEALQQYKKGWEVGQRAAADIYEKEALEKAEDERRLKILADKESLNQYTRGWQVGQRAAAEAYGVEEDGGGEEGDGQKQEGERMLDQDGEADLTEDDSTGNTAASATIVATDVVESRVAEVVAENDDEESFCQVCGLSESETAAHENCDGGKKNLLGPLLICDGNCSTFYHTSCAGLGTSPPSGEWYCPECADVPLDDPLPSPMRKEQHDSFDEAAAASVAELSAVRGRFVALRKQRDRLIARWKGERETQRRVEKTKRMLRRKREEEIVRLREVVLVLQEEVNMSADDREWLKQVMESTVAFSPSRLKRHRKETRGRSTVGWGCNDRDKGIREIDAESEGTLTLQITPRKDSGSSFEDEAEEEEEGKIAAERSLGQATSTSPAGEQAGAGHTTILEAMDKELSSTQKQFEAAKQQIMKQQRQLAKYKQLIQEQQLKLTDLEEVNSELASVGKASSVLASSPFGPLGGCTFGLSSAPSSPTQDNGLSEAAARSVPAIGEDNNHCIDSTSGTAFKTMKNWWAGDSESCEDKKEDEEMATTTEGMTAAAAAAASKENSCTSKDGRGEEEGGGDDRGGGGGSGGGDTWRKRSSTIGGGARMEGVVKEKAQARSAPFRNRLIGLLTSIEKEAKDYNSLKQRIKDENLARRASGSARERMGLPPRASSHQEDGQNVASIL